MPVLKPVAPGQELALTAVLTVGLIGVMCQIVGMVTMEWITGNGFKMGLFVFEGAGQTVRIPDDSMCDTGKRLVLAAQILSVLAGVISVFYAAFVVMDVVRNLREYTSKVFSPYLGGPLVFLLFACSTATWAIWLGQYKENPCGDLSSAAALVMPNMPEFVMPGEIANLPQMPEVSGLVANATAGLSNVPSMLPNASAGLPDMSGILGNATSGFDPAALANMSSMLPNGTGFDPAALANMSGMLSNPAALIPGASGTLTNAPAFNPAGAVNMFTNAPALNPAGLANSFTMAPALNPAAMANMSGAFTMPPFFNQGMAGMTMPPLSLAAVNGMPGLSLDKELGFSFVFYVIGSLLSTAAFLGHLVKRSIFGDAPLSIAKQIDLITVDKVVNPEASYQSYAPMCQPSPLSTASRSSTPPVSAAPSLGRSTGTPPVFVPTNSGPQVTPHAQSGQLPSFPVPTAPEASPRSSGSRYQRSTNERTFKL